MRNLGAWQGSFTRLSPQGEIQEDIPTIITLEGLNDNQTVRQTIQHFSPSTGEVVQNKVLEYSSMNYPGLSRGRGFCIPGFRPRFLTFRLPELLHRSSKLSFFGR